MNSIALNEKCHTTDPPKCGVVLIFCLFVNMAWKCLQLVIARQVF